MGLCSSVISPSEERQQRQLQRIRAMSEELFEENERLEREINRLTRSMILEHGDVDTTRPSHDSTPGYILPASGNPLFNEVRVPRSTMSSASDVDAKTQA